MLSHPGANIPESMLAATRRSPRAAAVTVPQFQPSSSGTGSVTPAASAADNPAFIISDGSLST